MKYDRIYNFSAGPSMLPEEVLESVRDNLMNYEGSGMCVMEMSHRSKVFQKIIDEAEQDLRDLMNIPDNYKVMFIQGGATLQFAMIPMNLMKNGVACYVETGAWSKKAINEAKKYGDVHVVASSKDRNYAYVPDCSNLDIPDNADYVYICENETIHGVTWQKLPNTKGHIRPVLHVPLQALQRVRLRHDLRRRTEEHRPRRHGNLHRARGSDSRCLRAARMGTHLLCIFHPCQQRLHVQYPQLLEHLRMRSGL